MCLCQPVASTISASVTPLARFISARTSAFLLPPSRVPLAFGSRLGAFFAGLAFLLFLAFAGGFAAFSGPSNGVAGCAEPLALFLYQCIFCRPIKKGAHSKFKSIEPLLQYTELTRD